MQRNNPSSSMLLVSILTFLSRIVGFFRIAIIASIFGGSGSADVLNLLYSFPNNLRKLLAEGAFSAGFIPLINHSNAQAWNSPRVIRSISTIHMAIVSIFTCICILGANLLVPVLFRLSFVEKNTMVAVFRMFTLYIPLTALSAIAMAVLHTRRVFFYSALAPVCFSLAVIGCILLFHKSLGLYAMPLGVLVGGITQFLVQIPKLSAEGYSLYPIFSIDRVAYRQFWKYVHAPLCSAGLFALAQQISITLASTLSEGSGSAFTNALVIWQLPQGLFTHAVITVFFPLISEYYEQKKERALSQAFTRSIVQLLVLLVPCIVIFMCFSREIVAVILQRGAFDASATERTARVLRYFAIGLLGISTFSLLQRVSYALSKSKLVLRLTAAVIGIDILLSIVLVRTELYIAGLGLAQTLSFSMGSIIFFIFLKKHFPSMKVSLILKTFCYVCAVSLLAGTVLFFIPPLIGHWWIEGSSLRAWSLTGISLSLYALIILGSYRLLGISIIHPKK